MPTAETTHTSRPDAESTQVDTDLDQKRTQLSMLVQEYLKPNYLSDEQVRQALDYCYTSCSTLVGQQSIDGFDELRKVENTLQVLADGEERHDNRLTRAQQEANKVFALGVYAYVEQNLDPDSEDLAQSFGNIRQALFAMSPNIVSYVGGLADQISVLSFAQRSPIGRRLADNVKGS